MITAADRRMIPLDALTWPVSWRFTVRAPWGETQQTLSADVPLLASNGEATVALGVELWTRAIAAAITHHVELLYVETMMWRGGLAPGMKLIGNTYGKLHGDPAPRDHSACVVMHTGHIDRWAARRLYLPAIPAAWLDGDVLGRGARDALEALGRAMIIGMYNHLSGSPMVWLLAYPYELDPAPDNLHGVAFRRVEYLRACWHTDKAPEPAGGSWP